MRKNNNKEINISKLIEKPNNSMMKRVFRFLRGREEDCLWKINVQLVRRDDGWGGFLGIVIKKLSMWSHEGVFGKKLSR